MKIVVPYKHKKNKNFQSINTLFSQEKLPTYTTAGCSQIRPPRLVLEVGGASPQVWGGPIWLHPAVHLIGQAGGGNISSKLCAVSVPTVRKFSGFKFVDTALRREDFEDSCSRTSVGHLGDGHFNIMDISRYDDSLE